MTLHDALTKACKAVEIEPPRRYAPGRWLRTNTLGKNGKGDGAVLIFDDERGGVVWNHQTSLNQRFSLDDANAPAKVDPKEEAKRKARRAAAEDERRQVERICAAIIKGCRPDRHPYLIRKGFPEEMGLVCENPLHFFPDTSIGKALAKALPEGGGPILVVPGRVGGRVTTVQFITAEGIKKNILRGMMSGASHRIASGRDVWVCEGVATALSVRAALRFWGHLPRYYRHSRHRTLLLSPVTFLAPALRLITTSLSRRSAVWALANTTR